MSDFVDAPVPYAVLTGAATGQAMPQCARLTVLSLLPCLAPIILLLIWQISAELGWIATTVFLALSDVVAATYRLTLSGEPGAHILVSARHAFAGFCMGGPLNGVSPLSERLTGTMIQMVRTGAVGHPLVRRIARQTCLFRGAVARARCLSWHAAFQKSRRVQAITRFAQPCVSNIEGVRLKAGKP
jgi:hypothetical protein